jgi:hypothetical protein
VSPHRLAVAALRLRSWALALLRDGPAPGPAPRVPAGAWRFFLEMEWCALPLAEALTGREELLDDDARGVLSDAAALERARVDSARAVLGDLGAGLSKEGRSVLVLKGGAAVAGGTALHLEDVDLIAEPSTAEQLRARYADRAGAHTGPYYSRFPARHRTEVTVELHAAVRTMGKGEDLLALSEPLPGAPGLLRLRPLEQLWHVLSHSVLTHPDRIGRIRDLLLVRVAERSCSPAEVDEVRTRAAVHLGSEALLAVLEMASGGPQPAAVDRYVRRRYLLLARWRGVARQRWGRWVMEPALTLATELTVPPRAPPAQAMLFVLLDAPAGLGRLERL